MSQVQDQAQNALVTSESPFFMISLVYHMALQKAMKPALQFCYSCVTSKRTSTIEMVCIECHQFFTAPIFPIISAL